MPSDSRDPAALFSLAVHELRTPVNVVAGYLRMLLRDTGHPLADRQRRMLEEAERSCARLTAIVAELSDVAKLDSGEIQLARAPLDLFALVGEAASEVHDAADRGVHLELRGEVDGAPLVGDATRLKTAFGAVFRAVLREQPHAITMAAERRLRRAADGVSAVIVIAPIDGVEAACKAPAAAFDDGRGGLGLALPLARRVFERHGGRLWASEGGAGRSAALVSLPLTGSGT